MRKLKSFLLVVVILCGLYGSAEARKPVNLIRVMDYHVRPKGRSLIVMFKLKALLEGAKFELAIPFYRGMRWRRQPRTNIFGVKDANLLVFWEPISATRPRYFVVQLDFLTESQKKDFFEAFKKEVKKSRDWIKSDDLKVGRIQVWKHSPLWVKWFRKECGRRLRINQWPKNGIMTIVACRNHFLQVAKLQQKLGKGLLKTSKRHIASRPALRPGFKRCVKVRMLNIFGKKDLFRMVLLIDRKTYCQKFVIELPQYNGMQLLSTDHGKVKYRDTERLISIQWGLTTNTVGLAVTLKVPDLKDRADFLKSVKMSERTFAGKWVASNDHKAELPLYRGSWRWLGWCAVQCKEYFRNGQWPRGYTMMNPLWCQYAVALHKKLSRRPSSRPTSLPSSKKTKP